MPPEPPLPPELAPALLAVVPALLVEPLALTPLVAPLLVEPPLAATVLPLPPLSFVPLGGEPLSVCCKQCVSKSAGARNEKRIFTHEE